MKSRDFKNSIGCSIVVLLLGVILICCPMLNMTNITLLYRFFFGIYAIIQIGQFLILYK